MYAMHQAVKHVVESSIPGDIVECGVWRGGVCMLAAHTLKLLGNTDRCIYLYDTFAGMSEPSEEDLRHDNVPAIKLCLEKGPKWCNAPLDQVRRNMLSTGYPEQNLRFVLGRVEDTIPGTIPKQIAVLRLDTDWYSSTLHEMDHLFPQLHPGGVLIVDDYGWWRGSRLAVDEYFGRQEAKMLLCRIDSDGARMGVKG